MKWLLVFGLLALFGKGFSKLGDFCDVAEVESNYGDCRDAENYKCELSLKKKVGICECVHTERLCGTNGKTYANFCELMEDAARTGDRKLEVMMQGPCDSQPVITSGPDHVRAVIGDNITLFCEAQGYPAPFIFWLMERSDNTIYSLPDDDPNVTVTSRGGPAKNLVTAWVMIQDVGKHREGDYTCVAGVTGRDGKHQSRTTATARVKVFEHATHLHASAPQP